MNAHDRRIFARKCKRHNITTEIRWKWWGGDFWIPLIDGWHVEWDSPPWPRAGLPAEPDGRPPLRAQPRGAVLIAVDLFAGAGG